MNDRLEIFAMSKIDKGLITRKYKELLPKKKQQKKAGNTKENWLKIIKTPFTKAETQLAHKNMKRCLTSISK